MRIESLAMATARLEDEMKACTDVYTFSSLLDNATSFDIVSNIVDDIAKSTKMYLGEKRWIRQENGYELRVGFAPTEAMWFKKYGDGKAYKGYNK